MLIHYDPDESKTVVSRRVCAFHRVRPSEMFAGCTCSMSISSERRSAMEIAEIKAKRRRDEDDGILAKAEVIRAARNRAKG